MVPVVELTDLPPDTWFHALAGERRGKWLSSLTVNDGLSVLSSSFFETLADGNNVLDVTCCSSGDEVIE